MRRDATRPEHRTHPRQAAKSPADNAWPFSFSRHDYTRSVSRTVN
jgi:hypothetical protein